jgi:RNA polymerase sigma-70 factor, ECF subfamily
VTADPDRVAALYRAHGPAIYARCRDLLDDEVAAETTTVEVFLRLLPRLGASPEAARAHIWRETTERCLNLRRRRPAVVPDLPARLEEALAEPRLARWVIRELAPEARAAAWLRWVDRLSLDDVARVLEARRDAVVERLSALAPAPATAPGPAPERRLDEAEVASEERRAHFDRVVLPRTLPRVERGPTPHVLRALFWFAPLLVGAAMVVMVIYLRDPRRPLSRGGPTLDVIQVGGRLRLAVQPAGRRWVLVVAVDAAGKTTVVYPPGGARSGAVEAPDGGLELGAAMPPGLAPGPVRLWAFFSRAPLAAADAVYSLVARDAPALHDVERASFLLEPPSR